MFLKCVYIHNLLHSLTVHSSTLATSSISCSSTLLANSEGTSGKPSTPPSAVVHVGMDSTSAGGIEICSSSMQYVDYSSLYSEFKRKAICLIVRSCFLSGLCHFFDLVRAIL